MTRPDVTTAPKRLHILDFVFDLLFNNTTDIHPQVHSTDTHGTNQVNFALLHIFGYQFAPRYKAIQEKLRTSLYGFEHPTQYGEILLKPVRKLHTDLIMEEWKNLQRIFVSLALKTTTQSIIVHHYRACACPPDRTATDISVLVLTSQNSAASSLTEYYAITDDFTSFSLSLHNCS